jgi:hypothetical protein
MNSPRRAGFTFPALSEWMRGRGKGTHYFFLFLGLAGFRIVELAATSLSAALAS